MLGRDALVIAQVALSLVLLMVTGLLVSGLRKLVEVKPGFDAGLLISVNLDPTVLLYTPAQSFRFYHQLLDQARALPGVESVALAQSVPLAPDQSSVTVVPEGFRFPNGRESATVLGGAVDENYFRTLQISIVHGRDFRAADQGGSHQVAIVNEEFAKTYWPGQDPVGKQLRLGGPDGPLAEVVGVAKTAHYFFLWESPTPYVYLPYDQNRQSKMALIVESKGNPAALAGPLRDLVRSLDSDIPFYDLRTGESYLKWGVESWLVLVRIVGIMGLVGLVLSMVGLYGLISYSVSRRTSEIGLRMAVGASQSDVFRLVIRQGLIIASLGLAIGGALTVIALPLFAAGLVGLRATNAAPTLAIPLVMMAVSALACYLPARRAAKLDPLVALRYE
jgi:predicted permease